MRLWTLTYKNEAGDTVTEWLPAKPAAVTRGIELDIPVRIKEQVLPAERVDMAAWLNKNQAAPPS
jgi:hypothetical protein